jgi:hypothetical protein
MRAGSTGGRALRRPLLVASALALAGCSSLAPVIDHHQHVFSPAIAALISTPERPFVEVGARDVVAELDKAGIRRAVLLSVAYLYASPNRVVEDVLAKVQGENDRHAWFEVRGPCGYPMPANPPSPRREWQMTPETRRMQAFRLPWRAALLAASLLGPALVLADHPAPKEADWIAKDFRFHTGEVLPDLRIHYTTIGSPSGEPVLVLHGTTGSGTGMLAPAFAGELFGPGSRSTRASTSSSFPTPSARGSRRSRPTGCAPGFRATTTTTWCSPSTGSSPKGSAFVACVSCSATRWAECIRGSGP